MTAERSDDMVELGREAARLLGEGPDAARRARQRAAIATHRVRERGRRRWIVPATSAAAIGVAVILGWWTRAATEIEPPRPTEASSQTRALETPPPPAAGRWIAAPADEDLAVPFEDGSVIRFAAGAHGRMDGTTGRERTIVLENGRVRAEIQPGTGLKWVMQAGPYDVTVVGTVFVVDWDPSTERLAVLVTRGHVRVGGAPIGDSPISVEAGRRLDADRRAETAQLSPLSDNPEREQGTEVPLAHELIDDQHAAGTDEHDTTPTRSTRRSTGQSALAGWKELAKQGAYAEALDAAQAIGFDQLCRRLPADDLKLLADAARLAPNPHRATEALEALHHRFPSTQAGRQAAFMRARLAMDAEHDPRGAVPWLRTYLDANPHGAFAREARGRLIDALRKIGDLEQARIEARAYLADHPDGPHAALARSIVSPR